MVYGDKVIRPEETAGVTSVIGEIGPRTAVGNLPLRIGRIEPGGGGWHQTEYVVLEPDETSRFLTEIALALGSGDPSMPRNAAAIELSRDEGEALLWLIDFVMQNPRQPLRGTRWIGPLRSLEKKAKAPGYRNPYSDAGLLNAIKVVSRDAR